MTHLNPFLNNLTPQVFGVCDPKFRAVADVFEQNLTERGDQGDVGASCSVMIDGEIVVDLWGGFADPSEERVWQKDTLCCCWSVSKTVGATLTLMLADRGLIDINSPVCAYWPEFGANGKDNILVRQVLNHTAGVSFVDAKLGPGEANDWDIMIKAIEDSSPNWPAGERLGYLNLTQGYLLGELCARVNGGRRLAQFFQEELATPLGLDWFFAVPDDVLPRLATVYQADPDLFTRVIEEDPDSTFAKSMKGRDPAETYNSITWRKAENGAGTGHTNARSMARLYGTLARGGSLEEVNILSEQRLADACRETVHEQCAVNGLVMRFSTGFEMNCPPATPMGKGESCFGYLGAGGSYAFADPSIKLGFGYSHNVMHMGVGPGPCGFPLVNAVLESAYS